MMRIRSALWGVAVVIAGCGPKPNVELRDQTKQLAVEQGSRFDVRLVGIFRDTLAYEDRRGIYVIVDRETGSEYLGVSGVGITETGSHNCGKSCTRTDER